MIKLPTIKVLAPLAPTSEIHASPCAHCPTVRMADLGLEDPESADIKTWSREAQLDTVFRCAWRTEKNCKGYCDFLGVTESDLATRDTSMHNSESSVVS